MMAITTRSSISVKPLRGRVRMDSCFRGLEEEQEGTPPYFEISEKSKAFLPPLTTSAWRVVWVLYLAGMISLMGGSAPSPGWAVAEPGLGASGCVEEMLTWYDPGTGPSFLEIEYDPFEMS